MSKKIDNNQLKTQISQSEINKPKLEEENNIFENKFISLSLLFLLIISLLLFNYYHPITNLNNQNNTINFTNSKFSINQDNLNQINSEKDLDDFIKKNQKLKLDNKGNVNFNYVESDYQDNSRGISIDSATNTMDSSVQKSVSSRSESIGSVSAPQEVSSSTEYSSTNVIEKGIDEPDIVKNDNKYIYTLSQNKIVIVNAYPANELSVLSTIKFNYSKNQVKNIFINKNQLIVFTKSYDAQIKVSNYNFLPYKDHIEKTNIIIFNVSDKKNPKKISTYSISGNYYDARLINNYIYFISKQYNYDYYYDYYGDYQINYPQIYKNNVELAMPSIYYFNMPYNNYNFHNIASINLDDINNSFKVKSFMLDNSDNMYVSENNIYITYNQYYNIDQSDLFKTVILPNFDKKIQSEISNLNQSSSNYSINLKNILKNYYTSLSEKEMNSLKDIIQEKMYNYQIRKSEENQNTIIHKISINNGEIKYINKTIVKGHLLNEFSLNQNKNNELRLATTTSVYTRNGSKMYNNVYVLDKDLNQIGKLENIARNEKIYSTRFIGDKLYMVTFKQIDPLFVINLNNSKNPKILGKLKIPGFSTYLHPYDKNHIIGLGYDTTKSKWGGTVKNGIKISLFDISDFTNPKEVGSYIIPGKYTNSIATNDYKAFLFSKSKNLLAIPIKKYVLINNSDKNNQPDSSRYNYYDNYRLEQSAYIFNITENKIKLNGKIIHQNNKITNNYWSELPSTIKRILFMDNNLYTISEESIFANKLNNLNLIKNISLGYNDKQDEYNNPEIYY